MVQRGLAGGLVVARRQRGLSGEIGDDAPGRADLAVPGDGVGVAQGDDDAALLERRGVAERDGHEVRGLDGQDRQVAAGIGRLDRRPMDLAVGGGHVIIAALAQGVIDRQDQPAGVDHHAGGVLVGDEIGIGRLRAQDRPRCGGRTDRAGTRG